MDEHESRTVSSWGLVKLTFPIEVRAIDEADNSVVEVVLHLICVAMKGNTSMC